MGGYCRASARRGGGRGGEWTERRGELPQSRIQPLARRGWTGSLTPERDWVSWLWCYSWLSGSARREAVSSGINLRGEDTGP